MISALLLSETRPWHSHNASFFYHFKTIEEVGSYLKLLSFLNSFLRKENLGESVHSTLNLRTFHILHLVESGSQELGTSAKAIENVILFLFVLGNCLL